MGGAAGYDATVIGVNQHARYKRSDRVITGSVVIRKTERLRDGIVLCVRLKSRTGLSRSALHIERQAGRFKTIHAVSDVLP